MLPTILPEQTMDIIRQILSGFCHVAQICSESPKVEWTAVRGQVSEYVGSYSLP